MHRINKKKPIALLMAMTLAFSNVPCTSVRAEASGNQDTLKENADKENADKENADEKNIDKEDKSEESKEGYSDEQETQDESTESVSETESNITMDVVPDEESEEHTAGMTGYIVPFDLPDKRIPRHDDDESSIIENGVGQDSYYNAVDERLVTPVKNQGNFGTCWSFATTSIIETALIKAGESDNTIDLSEYYLDYFTYHTREDKLGNAINDTITFGTDPDFMQAGGNTTMAGMTLLNSNGMAYESAYPYPTSNDEVQPITDMQQNDVQLLDEYFLQGKSTDADVREEIKRMITTYGSVAWSYYSSGYYENDTGNIYCYDEKTVTNHAITIVGWDDNYAVEKFGNSTNPDTRPTDKGAWIMKNSWGNSCNSNNGYYYISYYDKSLGVGNPATAVRATKDNKHDNNYFYSNGVGYYEGSFNKVAQVFTAKKENESLKAIAFMTGSTNVDYTIEIYTLTADGTVTDPTSGSCVSTTTGSTTYAGIYTIPLSTSVALEKGDTFAVVISFTRDTSLYFDTDYSYYNANAKAYCTTNSYEENGQSLICTSYNQWKDCVSYYSNMSFSLRINAFTDDTETTEEAPVLSAKEINAKDFANDASVVLSWTKTLGVEGYNVYRSKDGTEYKKVNSSMLSSKTLRYEDKNGVMGEYYYKVVPVKSGSEYTDMISNAVSVVLTRNVSCPETDQTFNMDSTDITISEIAGADTYVIERKMTGEDRKVIAEINSTKMVEGEISYKDETEGLLSKDELKYYVTAKKNEEKSDTAVIEKQMKVESLNTFKVRVSWKPVEDAKKYRLCVGNNYDKTINETSVEIDLKNEVSSTWSPYGYIYGAHIYALDKDSYIMSSSDAFTVSTTFDDSISLTSAEYNATTSEVTLSWDGEFANYLSMYIYRSSAENGTYQKVGSCYANDKKYTDKITNAVSGNSYYYKICETYNYAESAFSNIKSATIPDIYQGITVTPYTGIYDGQTHPAVTVENAGEGVSLRYSTNGSSYFSSSVPTIKDVGTQKIVVQVSKTGYQAKTLPEVTASISAKTLTESMIQAIPDQTYAGSAIQPSITVKDGDTTLHKNSEYIIKGYEDNDAPGVAKVIITGKGNYTGEVSKTFNINLKKPSASICYYKDKVDVTVVSVAGAEAYVIERSSDGKGRQKIAELTPENLKYTDTLKNILSEKNLKYYVTAKKASLKSEALELEKSINVSQLDICSVRASWDTVPRAASYKVKLNNVDYDTTSKTSIDIDLVNSISGYSIERNCRILVYAYDTSGNELTHTTEMVYVSTSIDSTEKAPSINVRWDDNENHMVITPQKKLPSYASMEIYCSNEAEGSYELLGNVSTSNGTYIDSRKNYDVSKTYYYKVKVSYNGQSTDFSDVASAKPKDVYSGITVTPYTGTYDGAYHPAVSVIGAGSTMSIAYSTDGGVNYSSIVPKIKDCQEKEIVIKVSYSGFADKVFAAVKAKVEKKTLTVGMVQAIQDQIYTGNQITPEVKLVDGGSILVKGTDYTVKGYSDNVGNGSTDSTATVTVEGIGNYKGEVSKTFKIIIDRTFENVTIVPYSQEYDRQAHDAVTVNGADGAGYSVEYSTNDGSTYSKSVPKITNVGSLGVKVKVTYQQSGTSKEKIFETVTAIVSPKTITIDMVQDIADQWYTGNSVEPDVSLKDGSTVLLADTDYEILSYKDNVNVGTTAAVTISGLGNYGGSVEKSFVIKECHLYDGMTVTPHNSVYDGTSHDAVAVDLNGVSQNIIKVYSVDNGKTYSSVMPQIKNVGELKVVVKLSCVGYPDYIFDSVTAQISSKNLENSMIQNIPDQIYNGDERRPIPTVKDGDLILVKDKDYIIDSYDNNIDIGIGTITISGIGNYQGTATAQFNIVEYSVYDEVSITPYTGEYDGNEHSALQIVLPDGITAKYSANGGMYSDVIPTIKDVGSMSITVKLSAAEMPEKELEAVTAQVRAKQITASMISDIDEQKYTGSEIKPSITVRNGQLDMAEGVDYEVSYSKNIEPGDAIVTVTAKGTNYTGTAYKNFKIVSHAKDEIWVDDIPDQTYTGTAIKPEINVYFGNTLLYRDIDYSISGYRNNTKAGTATITVRGKGNYEGTRTVTFVIKPKDILDEDVIVGNVAAVYAKNRTQKLIPTLTYNGKNLRNGTDFTLSSDCKFMEEGDYYVTFTGKGNFTTGDTGTKGEKKALIRITSDKSKFISRAKITAIPKQFYGVDKWNCPDVEVKLDGEVLSHDNYTVSYQNNTGAGTAMVVITGTGEYVGTKTARYNITRLKESLKDATIDKIVPQKYVKGGCKPEPVVKMNGKLLVKGIDYSTSYLKQDKVGTAKVRINGKGNYKDSVTVEYEITQRDISEVYIRAADILYKNTKNNFVNKPVLTDTNGNLLAAGRDYDSRITYSREGVELTKQDICEMGDIITVSVVGKGNYTGQSKTASFTLKAKSISSASVKVLTKKYYNGDAITLDENDLNVKVVKTELVYGQDYEIIEESYMNNCNKGTAYLYIRGINDYAGEKKISFRIYNKGIK